MRLEVAHNAVPCGFDIAFEDLSRVACDDTARGHVLGNDAAGGYDAVVPDGHSGQDDRACAKEAVGADEGADMLAFDEVVGEDVDARRYDGVVADVDAPRVGVVEVGLA